MVPVRLSRHIHSPVLQPLLDGETAQTLQQLTFLMRRKPTAHHTLRTQVKFTSLQQQGAAERLGSCVHSTPVLSCRRGASVVPRFHPPQRFSKMPVLDSGSVCILQFLPNPFPIYNLLLDGLVAVPPKSFRFCL